MLYFSTLIKADDQQILWKCTVDPISAERGGADKEACEKYSLVLRRKYELEEKKDKCGLPATVVPSVGIGLGIR